MRTYYIFKVNSILNPIYKTNKTAVYKLLNNINKLSKNDYKIGNRIYSKIVIPINKKMINNYLLSNHINDMYYIKNDNIHILDSTFEKSKLIVKNTYLKIETTNNISSFFKDLFSISKDLICIDFKNVDYFYIDELKSKLLV